MTPTGWLISIVGLIAGDIVSLILQLVVFVVTAVRSLALGCRRLCDAGFTGSRYLLVIIQMICRIVVIVMTVVFTRHDNHK